MVTTNDDLADIYCGVGSCRPGPLQCFTNIIAFTGCYSVATLVLQTLNVYIVSQITALEKQFGLSSTTTGVILSCNDIGFLSTVLFVSHFGKRGHIPRILSGATFLFGISGIMSSLCYFLDPASLPIIAEELNSNSSRSDLHDAYLCLPGNFTFDKQCSEKEADGSSGGNTWVVWLLGFSMVMQGIGKSPRTPLSTTYVDNNAPDKNKTSLYLGVIMALNLLGPALAIALGGVFRQLPVDLKETILTPKHPKWIGAWWLGFLVFGSAGIVVSIPLLLFPRRLRRLKRDNENGLEMPKPTQEENHRSLLEKIKDLPKSLMRVIRRPVYTLTLTGICCMTFVVGGSASFGPKYVEHQFMVPAYKTNIILGVQRLAGATFGTFLGGCLTSRLKLTRIGCMRFIMIVSSIAFLVSSLGFVFGCDNPEIKGLEEASLSSVLDNGLLPSCHCDSSKYLPVCGVDKKNYFSPCFAGCQNQTRVTYGNCAVVPGGTAAAGLCETDCPYLYYYIAVDMAMGFVGTLAIMPVFMTLIRSVEERDKSMSMALLSFFTSLLGFLPAPILYGYVIDGTCRIWQEKCGVKGACSLYDLPSLRFRLKSVDVCIKVLGFFFFVAAYTVLRCPVIKEQKEATELKELEKTEEDKIIQVARL